MSFHGYGNEPVLQVGLQFIYGLVEFASARFRKEPFLDGADNTLDKPVGLRAGRIGPAMINITQGQVAFVGILRA